MGLTSCQKNTYSTIVAASPKDIITELNEPQIYILKKQIEKADFNYAKLDSIDAIEIDMYNVKNVMTIFEPVSGQYKYFQFISTFIGQAYSYDEPPLNKKFHDILIIKTDKNKNIIDAYQYTLEWVEPPFQYDMFKSTVNGITLTNNMDIAQLKFMRTYGLSEDDRELKESGIIKFE
jgi:hypothetical protein